VLLLPFPVLSVILPLPTVSMIMRTMCLSGSNCRSLQVRPRCHTVSACTTNQTLRKHFAPNLIFHSCGQILAKRERLYQLLYRPV